MYKKNIKYNIKLCRKLNIRKSQKKIYFYVLNSTYFYIIKNDIIQHIFISQTQHKNISCFRHNKTHKKGYIFVSQNKYKIRHKNISKKRDKRRYRNRHKNIFPSRAKARAILEEDD